MRSPSSSTISTPRSSFSGDGHRTGSAATRTYRLLWRSLLLTCIPLVLAGLLVVVSAPRLRLYVQAVEFALGKTADSSSLGAFGRLIPVPEGWEVMGVSHLGQDSSSVVGLATSKSLNDAERAYMDAMRLAGWTSSTAGPEVGVLIFHRTSPPRRAFVMFRPTSPRSVTVVVQVSR